MKFNLAHFSKKSVLLYIVILLLISLTFFYFKIFKIIDLPLPLELKTHNSEKLIGCWHAMNSVASAYADRYCFSSRGEFSFFPSQYDEHRTVFIYNGRWELNNNTLILFYTKALNLDKTETHMSSQETLIIGEIEEDLSGSPYHEKIIIGDDYYWKYSVADDFWDDEIKENE